MEEQRFRCRWSAEKLRARRRAAEFIEVGFSIDLGVSRKGGRYNAEKIGIASTHRDPTQSQARIFSDLRDIRSWCCDAGTDATLGSIRCGSGVATRAEGDPGRRRCARQK